MYGYIRGKITEIDSRYVILENNDIGYIIYVPNPYSYKLDGVYTIFTYSNIKEDEYTLFGFKEREEKELFLKLISVKGLGPRMALPIMATGTIEGIADAIENNNLNYLKKFPKIGDKVAKQMVLDLKGKLNIQVSADFVDNSMDELVEVLEGLGYKSKEIKGIVSKVDSSLSIEDQVKEALKLLLK